MENLAKISPKVKELLANLNWNHREGTVKSSEILDLISKEKNLEDLIKSNNLENIKHKKIDIDDLLVNALKEAMELDSSVMETIHLLVATLKTLKSKKYSKVKDQVKNILDSTKSSNEKKKKSKNFKEAKHSLNKVLESSSNSNTNSGGFVKDLTSLAKKGKLKKTVSRPGLEDRLISMLTRKYKNSVMVVGRKGSGKTSLMISLTQRIAEKNVPGYLHDASVVTVNISNFLNSYDLREKLDVNLKQYIENASRKNKHTIFFFDDLHLLSSVGMFGFSPPLSNEFLNTTSKDKGIGNVSFISAVNREHADRFFDAPIQDLWETFEIPEPSNKELKNILYLKSKELGQYFNLNISKNAINFLIQNKDHLIKEESDSSSKIHTLVNILDDIYASFYAKSGSTPPLPLRVSDAERKDIINDYHQLSDTAAQPKSKKVGLRHVKNHFKKHYNVNPSNITPANKKLKDLDKKINKSIIGQHDAVDSLVSSIKRSFLGFSDEKKPLASILFLGPTGVGKTETAKELARNLFGKSNLIRIDMSDFMEKHTVARLVGSPPGYVGFGEGGQLTNFVSKNPHSVVLFDEIEKAHPDVLNILLQILEEGELTTGEGDVVSFKDAVVVLTSNLGAELIQKAPIGFTSRGFDVEYQNVKERLLNNLKKQVKPEILNRLNDVVVFRMLSEEDAQVILDKNIEEFNEKLEKIHNVKLKVTKAVKKHLLEKGYSKEYGAREIKRSIERNLIDTVVEYLIQNDTKSNLTLKAQIRGGEIELENC